MPVAWLIIARSAQIAASILVTGIFAFEVVTLGPVRRSETGDLNELERQFSQLALWSLLVALLSGLLWFCLEVTSMSGLSFAKAFSGTVWRVVLFETEFGRVWQVRLGLTAVTFALAAFTLAQDQMRRRLLLVLWLLSVVLLVSLAWISHAAAARVQPLGLLGDALHLCAAGAWIGGLAPLTIFLTRARASSTLGECAAPVLERFSTLSLCCVSVLAGSGIFNSWLLVGSIHSLFTTRYGWLLVFKLTLFGILVGFGARNRFVIKTKLLNAPATWNLLTQLRRNVICEACLGLAIVTIVACLGVTPPARHPRTTRQAELKNLSCCASRLAFMGPLALTRAQVMEFAFPRWENRPDCFQS
ncbi:MAG: copper resistance protein [Verrucomicrobiota bacterium]